MANYSIEALTYSAEQHEAAAQVLGAASTRVARVIAATKWSEHDTANDEAQRICVQLAREAWSHALASERARERMAAVLEAQVSHGNGPALTEDELRAAREVLPAARAGVVHGGR